MSEHILQISYNIPNTHCKIVLEVCNIFEQEGPKVIHCLNTFDTSWDVIREASVMGQFVKHCDEKNFDIEATTAKWIDLNKHKAMLVESLPCRQLVFNTGELCPVEIENELFLLVAFQNLQETREEGAMNFDSYLSFLDDLWRALGKQGMDKTTINIPAFGNKIVNVSTNGFTIDQKLGLIVQSYFRAMKCNRLFDTLRICIHETDAKNLNLANWEEVLLPYLHQFCLLNLGIKPLNDKQKGIYAGISKTVVANAKKKEGMDGKQKLIFISHSRYDCQEADVVYEYLESQGYKCWMDTHDITPGIPYAKEIMKGFNESSAVVVIISKNTMHSLGVLNEVDNVYNRDKIIIPFRIDDTDLSDELSFYLSSTQWINAFPKFEEHFEELGKALEQLLK